MTKYRVCFDGKWQGTFTDQRDALEWGKEVGATGRLVHVAEFRRFRMPQLVAVFPENQTATGQELWEMRMAGSDAGLKGGS